MEESLFIIRNDIGEKYKINENDSESVRNFKKIQSERLYAIYDKDKKMWSMKLPYWFVDSTNPNKCIQIESVSYYKPDGTADIGTTFHSPTLFDGTYNQFDYMVGLCSVGIYRTFRIGARCQTIEFFFRDYMDDENLGDTEVITEQKTDENGELLYYKYDKTEDTYVTNVTNEDGSTNEPYLKPLTTESGEELYWIYKNIGNEVKLRVVEKSTENKDESPSYIYPLVTKTNKYLKFYNDWECTTTPNEYPALYHKTDSNGNKLYYSNKVKDMQFSVETTEETEYPVIRWEKGSEDDTWGALDAKIKPYYFSNVDSIVDEVPSNKDGYRYLPLFTLTDFYMNKDDEVINRTIDTITNDTNKEDILGPLTYHAVNEKDEHLFIKKGEMDVIETTEETNYPATRKIDKPICFIIFTKLIY